MDKIKFTIVTVCYNAEKEIKKTMESLLEQDYLNYEYIIIDGNSKDKTVSKIQELKKKYLNKKIIFISEKDKGIYDAMNKAIEIAMGEWIIFMNAGDLFYSKEVLRKISKNLNDEYDVIYGNIVGSDKRFGYKLIKPKNINMLKESMVFCHQAVFVKTLTMKKYKFDIQYKIAADYNFFYKLYRLGYKFNYQDETIAIYDLQGISSNFIKNNLEKYKINREKKIFYKILKYFIKNVLKKIFSEKYLLERQRKNYLKTY